MKIHEKYISRCIQLAKNGFGTTFPNPMVGSVIVYDDTIIGEGFTSPYGSAHAEVNALASVKPEHRKLLSKSSLYVTLEPCSHFGKTPPCADHIIKHGLRHIIVGTQDPHKKVAGRGIKRLRDAGCSVIVGVLEEDCKEHHKRFLTFHTLKRPYIILKWAASRDGFIAPEKDVRAEKPEPFWISNSYSRQIVHQWRSQEQGILVGTNTVLADNPRLDVRLWAGTAPVRIIIDKDLKIPHTFHVMDGSTRTIIVTGIMETSRYKQGIAYEIIDFSKETIPQICHVLYKQNILSVLVEGGALTQQAFIDAQVWDEARIFTGNVLFGTGIPAPRIGGSMISEQHITDNLLTIKRND